HLSDLIPIKNVCIYPCLGPDHQEVNQGTNILRYIIISITKNPNRIRTQQVKLPLSYCLNRGWICPEQGLGRFQMKLIDKFILKKTAICQSENIPTLIIVYQHPRRKIVVKHKFLLIGFLKGS